MQSVRADSGLLTFVCGILASLPAAVTIQLFGFFLYKNLIQSIDALTVMSYRSFALVLTRARAFAASL